MARAVPNISRKPSPIPLTPSGLIALERSSLRLDESAMGTFWEEARTDITRTESDTSLLRTMRAHHAVARDEVNCKHLVKAFGGVRIRRARPHAHG